VCAFTKIGFKYKHQRPMNKVTQISLSPDHGIPKWCPGDFDVQLSSPDPVFVARHARPQYAKQRQTGRPTTPTSRRRVSEPELMAFRLNSVTPYERAEIETVGYEEWKEGQGG
jgi:hypothetical protein